MSDTSSGRSTATELTMERNRLAADRTLMAWIRTSLSLIGFGFGIGKVYDYLKSGGVHDSVDPVRSTLIFGGSFIVLDCRCPSAHPNSAATGSAQLRLQRDTTDRRDGCGHAAHDRCIRPHWDSSVTAATVLAVAPPVGSSVVRGTAQLAEDES
jgi:hypothetical protein